MFVITTTLCFLFKIIATRSSQVQFKFRKGCKQSINMLGIKFGSEKIVPLDVTKDSSLEGKNAAKGEIFCDSSKKINPNNIEGPRNSKHELPIAQNPITNTARNYALTRNKLIYAIHHLKKASGQNKICKMTDTPVLDSRNMFLMSQYVGNPDKKRSINQQYLQNDLIDTNVGSNLENLTSSAGLSNENGLVDKNFNKLEAMLANLRV